MPMDSTGMTAAVIAEGILGPIPPTGNTAQNAVLVAQRLAFLQAICAAIVQHIQSAATVTIPFVTGVTTGAGVSGPGVGQPPAGGVS
jgi:hypothetical protein